MLIFKKEKSIHDFRANKLLMNIWTTTGPGYQHGYLANQKNKNIHDFKANELLMNEWDSPSSTKKGTNNYCSILIVAEEMPFAGKYCI